MTFQIILAFHILIAIALVSVVLMQQGKGANAGVAFGSGSSQSLFGATGANSFLYKLTRGLAMAFFATSIALAYFASNESRQINEESSIINSNTVPTVPTIPENENSGDVNSSIPKP